MANDPHQDPSVALIALASALSAGELPQPEIRCWFARAVKAWLNGVPIDQALQVRREASFARRDRALCEAAALVGNDPARLAQEVRRHPHRRRTGSALEHHLDVAFGAGRSVPESIKQLRRIIRDGTRA